MYTLHWSIEPGATDYNGKQQYAGTRLVNEIVI